MSNRNKLSSSLTFIYKFIFPLFLICLIVFVNLTIDSNEKPESVIAINAVLIIFSIIAYLPLMNIKKVEYNKSKLIVSNFRTVNEYNLKDIKNIYCSLFYFYYIIIENKNGWKKVRYLAPARERIVNPFQTIKSVRQLKKIINI